MAIQRAEDKTAQMQARAGAIDELMASGALDDLGGHRDDIQSELDMISAGSDVESELARLKGELTASAPKQIEGGAGGPNGGSQAAQAQAAQAQTQQAQPGPYAPPAPQYAPPQQAQQADQYQQTQAAGLPVADLPGLGGEPQDGDG
jgi:hypothetical protein